MNINDFINIGLNEREAKIYNVSLMYGEANLGFLAKISGIKRTTAYDVLESLMEKKLIGRARVKKHYNYFANDPRDYREALELKKAKLASIIPQLVELSPKKIKKISLQYFEGEAGIKEIFRDSVKLENDAIVAWRPIDISLDNNFLQSYIADRMKKNISLRVITNESGKTARLLETDLANKRETKYVKKELPIEVEVIVYGKNLASIISFESKMGLIITSQHIHNTLRSVFELNWAALK